MHNYAQMEIQMHLNFRLNYMLSLILCNGFPTIHKMNSILITVTKGVLTRLATLMDWAVLLKQ
jgi:hypothetical protein